MTTTQITSATKNLTFQQATSFIENNSGLNVEKISEISTSIVWRVNNNKEICYISNSYKSLVTGMSNVLYTFN
jgi:hypothetical protein